MPRLIQTDSGEFFVPEDNDFQVELNENSMLGHFHRDDEHQYMDRVAILDPRDEQWWTWYRSDVESETFDSLAQAAQRVGTFLLRNTPLTETEARWEVMHRITQTDWEQLTGGEDAPQ